MLAIILGTLAVVIVTVAIGMLIDRKVSLLPTPDDLETKQQRERKKLAGHAAHAGHAAGEAPATALRIRPNQIAKLRTSQRCATCRPATTMHNDADDTVRYNDTTLLVLHFHCPACAATRSLYIDQVTT